MQRLRIYSNRRRAGHIETLLISVGGLVGCVALVIIGERVHLKPWLKSLGTPRGEEVGLILWAAAMVVGTLVVTLLYSLLVKFVEWREGR